MPHRLSGQAVSCNVVSSPLRRRPYRSSYDRVFLLDYPHARARPLIVEAPGQSRRS